MEWKPLQGLKSRYLPPDRLKEAVQRLGGWSNRLKIGQSVQGRPIEVWVYGKGPTRILMWSQMHGNETTTTRALLDWMKSVSLSPQSVSERFEGLTIAVVPMLNPDGAEAYTRFNANEMDLNRDAVKRSQPETQALLGFAKNFSPDFCFNLHDQRTFYGVGEPPRSAVVSFLAPAADPGVGLPLQRTAAMSLVLAMHDALEQGIPGHLGRYDDTYNPNCFGDHFQTLGIPTVLLEAGHSPGDYLRESTREQVFKAIVAGLDHCRAKAYNAAVARYNKIPENRKIFSDLSLRNARVLIGNCGTQGISYIQYSEVLREGEIDFVPGFFQEDWEPQGAHRELDLTVTEDLRWVKTNPRLLELIDQLR